MSCLAGAHGCAHFYPDPPAMQQSEMVYFDPPFNSDRSYDEG